MATADAADPILPPQKMPDSFDPHDRNRPSPPMTPGERWILAAVTLLFFGLLAVEILTGFSPAKAGALFFPLAWIPLVVLHEFGHAAMTRLCGWKAEKLVIGFGRSVTKFRLGQTLVELRAFPIEGFVMSRPHPGKLRFPRLKLSLIYAAGPGIEILLLLAIYAALGDRLLTPSQDIPIIAAQSVALAIAFGVILNLIPISPSGVWSDGQGIIMSWLIPHHWFKIWSRGEEIDLDSASAHEKPRIRRPNDSP